MNIHQTLLLFFPGLFFACTNFAWAKNDIVITTLNDNSVGLAGGKAEWGLSFYIEDGTKTILFDTGSSQMVVENAYAFHKDLSKVDYIVLSHGHMDHTGGLLPVLQEINRLRQENSTQKINIVANPDIWTLHYGDEANNKKVWYGMLYSKDSLEGNNAEFKYSREPVWLSPNIVTTGEIKMQTSYEQIEEGLLVKKNGEFFSDPLLDDQALIIKTSNGLVVILGCAHRGVINTLLQAQNITGEKRIYMVLGGMHLYKASPERIEKTIADLKKLGVQKIGASHCTGLTVAQKLAQAFGDDVFFFNSVGNKIAIEQ